MEITGTNTTPITDHQTRKKNPDLNISVFRKGKKASPGGGTWWARADFQNAASAKFFSPKRFPAFDMAGGDLVGRPLWFSSSR